MSNAPSLLQPTYDAGAMHRFSLPVYEPHPLFTQFTQGKLSRIHPDGGELWYHDFIAQQKEPHERTQHKPPCSNAQQSHHAAPPDRRTPRTSPTGQPCTRLFGRCLHATFPQQHLPFRSARIGTISTLTPTAGPPATATATRPATPQPTARFRPPNHPVFS